LILIQFSLWGRNILYPRVSFAYIPAPQIKVKIAQGKSFTISAKSAYEIQAEGKSRIFYQPIQIKLNLMGISINGDIWGEKVEIKPATGSLCEVNKREYRGAIIIRKNQDILEVINKLSLEEYLYGLIKLEISPNWPLPTLCAQAIVARTYALRKLWSGETLISSDSQDQVYGGMQAEDPRGRIAVDLTRGEILTFQGAPINAVYHASSGGYLASSKEVWEEDFPYLIAKKDPFSTDSPYQNWTVEIPKGYLEWLLKRAGFQVENVSSIEVIEKDSSGRVKVLLILSKKGVQYISGRKLREVVGFDLLRSTLFEVKNRKYEFIFKGHGWGHGVGMSQWGAAKMGKMGYTTEEILQFYYPGTKIHKAY